MCYWWTFMKPYQHLYLLLLLLIFYVIFKTIISFGGAFDIKLFLRQRCLIQLYINDYEKRCICKHAKRSRLVNSYQPIISSDTTAFSPGSGNFKSAVLHTGVFPKPNSSLLFSTNHWLIFITFLFTVHGNRPLMFWLYAKLWTSIFVMLLPLS